MKSPAESRSAAVPQVAQALAAMRGKRALLVGDFMLDAYLYGETVRISREAPVLVVRKERQEHRLGGAANTAANLLAYGVQTQIVGAVGDDAAGAQLRQMLQDMGADTSGLRAMGRTTAVKTRILAGAFGTSKQQVLRVDEEPDAPLPDAAVARLADDLESRAGSVDVIVVSDYGVGTVTAPMVAAVKRLGRAGHTVCVDSRYNLRAFAGVTAVTPNVPEAEGAVGFHLNDAAAVARAGALLLRDLECRACLVTQGRRGMTLFLADGALHHTEVVGAKEVTDVTGAGDTVIATLGAALAAGLGFHNGMLLANCAAGVVVTKVGTATASAVEISHAVESGGVTLTAW